MGMLAVIIINKHTSDLCVFLNMSFMSIPILHFLSAFPPKPTWGSLTVLSSGQLAFKARPTAGKRQVTWLPHSGLDESSKHDTGISWRWRLWDLFMFFFETGSKNESQGHEVFYTGKFVVYTMSTFFMIKVRILAFIVVLLKTSSSSSSVVMTPNHLIMPVILNSTNGILDARHTSQFSPPSRLRLQAEMS